MVFLFSVPAYVIMLRETLEITIILAVLLGFIDKLVSDNDALRKKLKKQIWIGVGIGFIFTLIIGAIFITVFYTIQRNLWEDSEDAWEGAFSLIASVIITFMALGMLRVQQWKAKWENKLKDATENYLEKNNQGNRWALILLPLTVVCREGVESIVFIAGIGFQNPASGLPIPIITGIISGLFIGFLIYKGSHTISLSLFFTVTTVFLLFVGAGLFSTSVQHLQEATGTYQQVLWQLHCCGGGNQFWSLMQSIFGWRNKATVGTTVAYFLYWFVIILISLLMWYKEKRDKKNEGLERNDQLSSPDNVNDSVEKNEKDGQAVITVIA